MGPAEGDPNAGALGGLVPPVPRPGHRGARAMALFTAGDGLRERLGDSGCVFVGNVLPGATANESIGRVRTT